MYVQRQQPGFGALFAIPTAVTTGGTLVNTISRTIGVSPTTYTTPERLERTRGDAVSQAEADVRAGQTMGTYNAGSHTETADPLNTLQIWAVRAARSGTRAAASAALQRLVTDGVIRPVGPLTVIHFDGTPVQLANGYQRAAGAPGTPGAQPGATRPAMAGALPLLALGAALFFLK